MRQMQWTKTETVMERERAAEAVYDIDFQMSSRIHVVWRQR